MKFSTKLTLLFSGIVLVMGLSVSFLVYRLNAGALEKDIEKRLKSSAFSYIDKLDRNLFERYGDIRLLAADPVITKRGSTAADITSRLRAFRDFHKVYATLSFFDLKRTRIADTSGERIGRRHTLSEYWREIEEGREFVMDVSYSESLKKNVFHFAQVVKDRHGAPFGVVVSRVPVDRMFELMETPPEAGMGREVQIDLVDRDGMILYSNYNRAGIFRDILYDWESIKSRLDSGEKMGTMTHSDGEEEITAFVREPGYLDFGGNGWTLVLDVPTEVAFAPAIGMRNRLFLIFSAFGAVSIVIVFFFSKRVSDPLQGLSAASLAVGKGNLNVNVETSSGGEIGTLAKTFNQMVKNLREYRDRLLSNNMELEKGRETLIEAQRIARLGNWEWDLKNDRLHWSEETFNILGINPDGFTPANEAFINRLHPDDMEPVRSALNEVLRTGTPASVACRVLLTDGAVRIAHVEARTALDDMGIPVRMWGTIQDLTERKKAEEELKKLNDELRKALEDVKRLSGLLPICSSCKKIRDDKGYWSQIEEYLHEHSDAEFTHSICPECAKNLYPEFYKKKFGG